MKLESISPIVTELLIEAEHDYEPQFDQKGNGYYQEKYSNLRDGLGSNYLEPWEGGKPRHRYSKTSKIFEKMFRVETQANPPLPIQTTSSIFSKKTEVEPLDKSPLERFENRFLGGISMKKRTPSTESIKVDTGRRFLNSRKRSDFQIVGEKAEVNKINLRYSLQQRFLNNHPGIGRSSSNNSIEGKRKINNRILSFESKKPEITGNFSEELKKIKESRHYFIKVPSVSISASNGKLPPQIYSNVTSILSSNTITKNNYTKFNRNPYFMGTVRRMMINTVCRPQNEQLNSKSNNNGFIVPVTRMNVKIQRNLIQTKKPNTSISCGKSDVVFKLNNTKH